MTLIGFRKVAWSSLASTMVLIFTLLLWCRPCQARTYIDINAPYLRKIPTAIPLFKNVGVQEDEAHLAVSLSNALQETLDFTGFFKMLDRQSFLENSQEAGLTRNTINFQNWTAVGAELLFKGAFQYQGDILELECRLFDTFGGNLLLGKRYTGRLNDQQLMIRRFCDEVILRLTGRRGIFTSKIAFISTTTGNKEIFISDFDGGNPRPFTKSGAITLFPAWSSDGKWLAYTDYRRGRPNLFISQVNGKQDTVVSLKGSSITPAWVPGEFALAASLSYEGNPTIYLLTGTGKIVKKLTRHWGIDVAPSWSPDGKAFAFVSNRSGSPQVYIKEIESGNVRRLTFDGKYNTAPAWSPQGHLIAYAGSNDGHFDIFVIGLDGLRGAIQLTHEAGNNESPSWSPDGTLIAFSSDREGPYRIYLMNANGTDQRRLLEMKGEQTNPSWSPRLGSD
jgi:TolB protein